MSPRIPSWAVLRPGTAISPLLRATFYSKPHPKQSEAAAILSVGETAPAAPGAFPSIWPNTPTRDQQTDRVRVVSQAQAQAQAERDRETAERIAASRANAAYLRQMPRRWALGEVYAPHDLSADEMRKSRRQQRTADLVDLFGLKPLDMYKNFNFLAYFMTPGGQIQHSNLTMLRPVNQRKVAKAIRRAIGLGIHPSIHRHPEILKREFQMQSNYRLQSLLARSNVHR